MEAGRMNDEKIIISKKKDYQEIIKTGIRKFNNEKHPENSVFQVYREKGYNDPFGFSKIFNNEIIGGIIAYRKMQWLDIDILFVDENFRNRKIGSQLINKAAEYCKAYDLVGMHLYTLDFQAKGFYEKQGFELIAEIKDWPKGITRYEFVRYIK